MRIQVRLFARARDLVGANRVELQVDVFGDWDASKLWMRTSPGFKANPIGVFVDPAKIAERAARSEPFEEIHRRAMAGELSPAQADSKAETAQ